MTKKDIYLDKTDFLCYFKAIKKDKKENAMRIHCCAVKAKIFRYPAHSHSRWEIICHLEGEADVQVGSHRYRLTPGDVLLIPPGMTRKGSSQEGFRDIALRADGISFLREEGLHDSTGDITSLMFIIHRIMTEQKRDYLSVAEGLIRSLAQMIHQILGDTCSPVVARFKAFLYDNLSNVELQLSEEIAKTGYDPDYFRRHFKKQTEKTPLQYLTDLRMTQAKALLSDKNDLSVATVAASCGFGDSFYFSKCFKKHTGLSPLAYRKAMRG